MDLTNPIPNGTIMIPQTPCDNSEQDESVFKRPKSPCANIKIENTDNPHSSSQISSPPSVHSNSPLSDPFISSTSNMNDDLQIFSSGPNMSTFQSIVMAHPTNSTINNSGIEQLLTCTVSTQNIPRMGSPQDSLISSPVNGNDTILSSPEANGMESANTEYTLIDRAGRFNIRDGEQHDSPHFDSVRFDHEHDHGFEQLLDYVVTDTDSNKVPKMRRDSDAPSSINKEEEEDVTVEKLFEADLAQSSAEFSFSKFGSEVSQGIFTFGQGQTTTDTTTTGTLLVSSAIVAPQPPFEPVKSPPTPVTRSQRGGRHLKEPVLCHQYPSRTDHYELRILDQPEEQHRARYLTEGSRGAIKNVSQEGNPVVKLFGDVDHATLQVFIGNDQGRVKPHAFYQACKVCGKNSTPCSEVDIEGTVVIQMEMDTVNDKTCSIDNVGILKLRNADVENRVGIQKAKKKSTKARLIFRVMFQKPDGNIQTLQVASRSINCTQPIGQPEICKMSLREASVSGTVELIMIGKNFMKGTKVFFQELSGEDGSVVWEKESEIDKDFFQPTHLVCIVPPYLDSCTSNKVKAQVVVRCGGKQSESQSFTYLPVFQVPSGNEINPIPPIKLDTPMETDEQPASQPVQQMQQAPPMKKSGPLNITIAPEALRLNQQLQESLADSDGKFMLPEGAVSGITSMQVDQASTAEVKQTEAVIAEEQTFTKESNLEPAELENGQFSIPERNREPLTIDTQDLNSILKSLDEKPVTLQDMLTQPMTDHFTTVSIVSSQMPLTQINNQMTMASHPVSPNVASVVNGGNGSQPINSPLFNNQPPSHTSSFTAQSNTPNVVSGPIFNSLIGGSEINLLGNSNPNQQIFQTVGSNSQPQNFDNGQNNVQNNPVFQPGMSTPLHQQTVQNFSSVQTQQNLQNIAVSFSNPHSNTGMTVQNNNQIEGYSAIPIQNSVAINVPNSIGTVDYSNVSQSQGMSQSLPKREQFSHNHGFSVGVNNNVNEQQNILHGLLSSSVNILPTQIGNVQNVQRFGVSNSCLQQINATPVMATSSASTNQQKGYSDVAMRLLQQLLVKSSGSDPLKASEAPVQNSLNDHNSALFTSPSGQKQQSLSMVQTHPTLQIPMVMNAQAVSSPSVQQRSQVSNQGLLHQILSQGIETRNVQPDPTTSQTSPQVQQLDSLRLQAMAQQVQQQAQSVQTTQQTNNGNNSRGGPQIIVLGGGAGGQNTGTVQQNNQAGSPSILILPGAGGNNSGNAQTQVETILRSILGSLKPEPQ